MAQKLSYAGVTLPLVTPRLEEDWLAEVHPRDVFERFSPWNFNEPSHVTNSLPTPAVPVPPKFKFGVLHWPTGASRPAWFHAIVERERLDKIRTVIGNPGTPQFLVMFDGRMGKIISARMYMLPAMPLNQLGRTKSDGWLLTLTDQRFFWHWKRGVITVPTDWADLYGQLATTLELALEQEEVDAAYGTPSKKWASSYGPTPAILDAVAETVGQRIVVSLDGAVSTVNPLTAKADCEGYVETADTKEVSGGLIDVADLQRYVPAEVKVLFFDKVASPPTNKPHVVAKTLESLALSSYGTSTGMVGFNQIVNADTVRTSSNSTEVESYATKAATDWYLWRLGSPDIVWPGVEPYKPTGWEDVVEWTFQRRDTQPFASTHVVRGPWNDFPSGDFFAGEAVAAASEVMDCGWIAGMHTGWCFTAVVISSDGECLNIGDSNTVPLELTYDPEEGKWVSDRTFVYDTGEGPMKVWLDQSAGDMPGIAMSVNEINLVRVRCAPYKAVFALGNRITQMCTEPVPSSACMPNTAEIEVSCGPCLGPAIPGWGGPGPYCIVAAGTSCSDSTRHCVMLTEADRNNTNITICDGPFVDIEECEAACNPPLPTKEECTERFCLGYTINNTTFGTGALAGNFGPDGCMWTDGGTQMDGPALTGVPGLFRIRFGDGVVIPETRWEKADWDGMGIVDFNRVAGPQTPVTLSVSSGSSQNPCPVQTSCCPDDPLPNILFLKFKNGTGNCACLNGTVLKITYDPTAPQTPKWWYATKTLTGCASGTATVFFRFRCAFDPKDWLLEYGYTTGGSGVVGWFTPVGVTCGAPWVIDFGAVPVPPTPPNGDPLCTGTIEIVVEDVE